MKKIITYKKLSLIIVMSVLLTLLFSTIVLAGSQEGNAGKVFEYVVKTPAASEKGIVVTENGYIYYRTADTKATTNITYATVGLVISDKNNPSNGTVINEAQLAAATSILVPGPNGEGQVYAEARYIGNLSQIAAQLGVTSLRMDCIMETRVNGVTDGLIYTDSSVMALVASSWGLSTSEVKSVEALLSKYGWKDPSGIASHFDWILELVALGYSEKEIEDHAQSQTYAGVVASSCGMV